MKKIIFYIFILFSFITIYSQNSDDVIKKLQIKFASIEDIQADFTNSFSASPGGTAQKKSGKFLYKKSDKYVFEFQGQTIVNNGRTIWNYDKKQKRVMINNAENDPSAFSFEKYINEYPSKCDVSAAKELSGLIKLKLTAKSDDLFFASAVLWVDQDNLVRKFEITDDNGTAFRFELNNIKVNKGIPESKFNFTPPEGSKIIDLR